jgi:hypothetical protein
VVGTERNFRHVSYAIQEEFMALVGVEKSDALASKWRSKREVIEWLKSFTRKEPSFYSVEQKTLGMPSGLPCSSFVILTNHSFLHILLPQ